MKYEIGGYFGLENKVNGVHYHSKANLKLNSASSAFKVLLRLKEASKVYLPYYICNSIVNCLKSLKIEHQFYAIDNQLFPITLPKLQANEYFLYVNYFGLQNTKIAQLAKIFAERLIVDNAQAFFAYPIGFTNTFYSARKFFGVPDGGYLYAPDDINIRLPTPGFNQAMVYLLKRIECGAASGYEDFVAHEKLLLKSPIEAMSQLTNAILRGIDYAFVRQRREENFYLLHEKLIHLNQLELEINSLCGPLTYPLLINCKKLKQRLLANNIYIPTYWPDIAYRLKEDSFEKQMLDFLIPLPIDQRYNKLDMLNIIKLIN